MEKTSGTDALAGLFQVRHAVSYAGERSVYRKTDLEHFHKETPDLRNLHLDPVLTVLPVPRLFEIL